MHPSGLADVKCADLASRIRYPAGQITWLSPYPGWIASSTVRPSPSTVTRPAAESPKYRRDGRTA